MTGTDGVSGGAPRTSPLRVVAALGGLVLALVAAFGLGVSVGKRSAGTSPEFPAPPSALPTETLTPQPPPPAAPIPAERLTFYDRLSGAKTPTAALPEGQAPAPASATEERASQAEQAAAARVRVLAGQGRFAVQVAAASDRAAADEATARLRRHGLDAMTVAATVKGRTWYRTRVGSFPSQQAAAQAAGILGTAFGYDAIPVSD